MKYKALFILLLATMLVTPVFAFIHPPPPPPPPVVPCETFGVKIEGEWCYDWAHAIEFHEPEDNFCDTFTVQVLAMNVTDLYGFEYKLHWSSTYFALEEIAIEQVWADQLIVLNQNASSWHKLVMVAKAPSPGVNDPNGGILLCTYTFHIVNDVCWPQGVVEGAFWIDEMEMSDSCTGDLDPCDPINAYWKFFPAEPEVYIEPEEDINCVVGELVTYSVVVHNITKMKSLHFTIKWKGNKVTNPYETVWLAILNLTEVVINEDVFPEANRTVDDIYIFNDPANLTSYVTVDIEMECTYPLINGTVKAVDLIFEKMDPWWCGRQPGYDIDLETHEMRPDNATTPLWFDKGWIDVMCPDLAYIYFGEYYEGFTAPYTFTDETTVSTSWPANPYITDMLFTVKVTHNCATDKMAFQAEWWNNTLPNPNHPESAGIMFDVNCDGWADFEVIFHETAGIMYQEFDGVTWVMKALPGYIYAYGPDWGSKGHFWVYMELPREVLTPEPCNECYKWGIEARDTNEVGNLIGMPGQWIINYPFCDYNIGENWYIDANHPLGGSYYLYLTKTPVCSVASYNEAKFTFMPVPGDLTGDGIVDIKDLTAIAAKYCTYWSPWPGTWEKFFAAYYYDFNKDGHIDIFDIIVVSKNWERTCPF